MAGGRPSKLDKLDFCMIEILASYGLTDDQIATVLGVTQRTFDNWKKKNNEFFLSLKKGKSVADAVIVKSLYHRAKGYSHKEDKIFCSEGKPVIIPTVKHYPPDTTAIIFWLKNRQPERWRDKQEIETNVQGKVNCKYDLSNMSVEQLKALVGEDD